MEEMMENGKGNDERKEKERKEKKTEEVLEDKEGKEGKSLLSEILYMWEILHW